MEVIKRWVFMMFIRRVLIEVVVSRRRGGCEGILLRGGGLGGV